MPRPRFTLRWLMVAVAVVAIAAFIESRRRERIATAKATILAVEYRERARDAGSYEYIMAAAVRASEANEAEIENVIAEYERELIGFQASRKAANWKWRGDDEKDRMIRDQLRLFRDSKAKNASSAIRYRMKRDYYAATRAKYERAARYPWLPVAPDPPEPE